MENQDDVDYVDLLKIRGYIRKIKKKQNRPTEKSNKNYGLSDKIALRKNV
jgi:hypothetical protein